MLQPDQTTEFTQPENSRSTADASSVAASVADRVTRPSGLPLVSDEVAALARGRISQSTFVPTSRRVVAEWTPDPELIVNLDQGQEGASVGFALAAVLNYLRAERGTRSIVSVRMLYELARRYDEWSGEEYVGSSLLGGVTGLMHHGVCLDHEWSYLDPEPEPGALESAVQNRPIAVRRVERNIEQLRRAVLQHHAVAVGAELHAGWGEPQGGVIQIPSTARAEPMGTHAFAVIGFVEQGFIVQNSWGERWGGLEINSRPLPGCAIWKYEDAAARLSDAWVVQLSSDVRRAPLVSVDADTLDGEDLLDIKEEVNSFSYVLASRAIKPPLAVGLFGDWGGGKSFFMQQMQRRIAELSTDRRKPTAETTAQNAADESPFCRNIVQIRFNAWHYLDSDLWASLVTEIFDKLFAAIGGKSDRPEDKLPKLAAELQDANGVYREAQQQLADAQTLRKSAEAALNQAIQAREALEGSLLTQLNDVAQLVRNEPAVQRQVEKLATELGIPSLRESFAALAARAADLNTFGSRFADPELPATAGPVLIPMPISNGDSPRSCRARSSVTVTDCNNSAARTACSACDGSATGAPHTAIT